MSMQLVHLRAVFGREPLPVVVQTLASLNVVECRVVSVLVPPVDQLHRLAVSRYSVLFPVSYRAREPP